MQDSRDSKSMRKCNNHAKHIVTTPDLQVKTAESSAEVIAVFKDCHQRLEKVLLK